MQLAVVLKGRLMAMLGSLAPTPNELRGHIVTHQCGRILKLNAWTFSFDNFLCGRIISCSPREKTSQLAAGTCEIVTLDRDSSQPRRTIARQTARCACKKGQIAGTTRARPACVDARIIKTKQWCEMLPCLEGEGCDLLINKSGWTCTQPGGRIKTTTLFNPIDMNGVTHEFD
ncbi:hypothetical protein AAES_88260 [Amazona aestiva]|uniref:Protein FAM19A5 n=1 Tax=Amazona aestiva TaxID=12930 RepID=A0A0Q3R696_AMAAE|nr:hypothetical protein AAES_88260 [Amazona aestiva]